MGGYVARGPSDACPLGHKRGRGERGGAWFRTPCPVQVIGGEGQEGSEGVTDEIHHPITGTCRDQDEHQTRLRDCL